MLTAFVRRSVARPLQAVLERFARADEAVAAVEFAFIAPVLVLMLGGVVEMSGAITASNRASYVSDALAEMVSRLDHTATTDELKNFAVSAALVDPDLVRYAQQSGVDIEKAFKVTVTSVQFEPQILTCLINCQYNAKVVFSYTLNGAARSCGTLTPAAANAQTPSTLPKDVYGPGSLIVVDVEAFYRPVMNIRLPQTISFKRSSYFRPRYVSRVNYASNCSGY